MKKDRIRQIIIFIVGITAGVLATFLLLKNESKTPGDVDQNQTAQNVQSNHTESDEDRSDSSFDVSNENGELDLQVDSETDLVLYLKSKYADKQESFTYLEPINNVHRTDSITLEFDYDFLEKHEGQYDYEVCEIYLNPELTQKLSYEFKVSENHKELILSPGMHPKNKILLLGLSTEVVSKYSHSGSFFFDKGYTEWGNIKTMYLVCYYDQKTGEKLDSPTVRVVNLEGEIPQNPIINYSITSDGRINIFWEKVEGAEGYIVCSAEYTDNASHGVLVPLGYTEDNSWCSPSPTIDDYRMNVAFKNFEIGEDDWLDPLKYESLYNKYAESNPSETEAGAPIRSSNYDEKFICVVAISKEGNSMPSNMISFNQIASYLPYTQAQNATRSEAETKLYRSKNFDSPKDMPTFVYVEMCDGRVLKKIVDYDTENAEIVDEYLLDQTEDGEYERVYYKVGYIPYRVEGTGFIGVVKTTFYDGEEAEFTRELSALEEREETMRMKGGSITPSAVNPTNVSKDDTDKKVAISQEIQIYSNSALSEYLAINMLAGKTVIPLSDFPETASDEILMDTLLEAYYQNPLILGIESFATLNNHTYLYIKYDYDQNTREEMQQEILKKVQEITAAIITENMTDTEKEMAINDYLCSHLVYSRGALEEARKNNYVSVSGYKNAFNAYGALVEGNCVCRGYADAFNLLAKEAGLPTILVTGMLDGEVPHAWNKVKIDNKWCIIDTTNNDSEFMSNALFNIPSGAVDKVLVENQDYVLDTYLKNYEEQSESYEYYHLTENFYDVDAVVQNLTEELQKTDTKKVVLRTDYKISDADFDLICAQVKMKIDPDTEIMGGHFLGVICIIKK